jgi:hypothetical protein
MADELTADKKALDVSDEIRSIEGVETDEELLLARDVIGAFVKTIKAFRFYPAGNPTLKGFQEQLFKKFHYFLGKYDSFILQIGEYEFSFGGKVLYENRDVKTSIAFAFYKDGLRELRFMRGLEEWEIQGLIDIVKQTDKINQLEDDVVTLIWERDFAHIGYLSTDEFLEESSIPIPEDMDQFRKNLVFTPPAHTVEIDPPEGDVDDEINVTEALLGTFEDRTIVTPDRDVYFLTSDEAEALRKEVEAELDPAFVFNVTEILFEILALEKEKEPFQDAANILGKVLDALLTLGDFQKAGELLKRLYLSLKIYELKDWQVDIIQHLIMEASEDPKIERIGRVLEREDGIRLEDVSGYLVLLQRNAIKPLIKLLGELRNSKTRRVICDALSEIGQNAIELIAPFIDDRRWFLVRNITYILGRIGKDQAFPHIQKALNHEDLRVRREAIQALGLIGNPKAVGLLVKALSDEDLRIRSLAAINLGKGGKAAGLIPLLEVVQSKDFHRREPQEIKAFFDAVGMVGSNEATPVLQQLLERKSLFGRGKTDEVRIGAAMALAMIGTPEAKVILESGKQSKDGSIRNACLLAMRSQSL